MSSAAARGQSTMSGVTAHVHATLDGVIDAAPAEAFKPYRSDEGMQATIDLALAADALLLGRGTWQQLAKAWRSQSAAIAERRDRGPAQRDAEVRRL